MNSLQREHLEVTEEIKRNNKWEFRKRLKANAMKEARKTIAFAKLNNCPTSPRKMRLIADLIRGMDADKALSQLKLNPKEASGRMEKLLLSALANWEVKNEGKRMDESNLYISEVKVDSGRMLKGFSLLKEDIE